ncbi:hypothetical protein HOY80DRAFT_1141862 [Tuber brumale]|nr:hypothetical protein HOY80DRAFT_1141862 [Tuber brumale]
MSSSTQKFATKTMLSLFYKRDTSGDQKHDNDGISPGEILAIVIAALTLLVAIIPLYRCSRFRRWVCSWSILPFVKKTPSVALPGPVTAAVRGAEDLSAAPVPEMPLLPDRVLIYISYFNPQFVDARSNTFPYGQNGIIGEDGGAPRVDGSLWPGRPEPAVLRQPRQR